MPYTSQIMLNSPPFPLFTVITDSFLDFFDQRGEDFATKPLVDVRW